MTQAAAKTGVGPTVTVAVEQQFPENQRIIEDNLAYSILPFSMRTTETGIRTTFDFLAKAARGSRLVFTYIRKDFLDGQVVYGQAELYKQYVVRNKVWLFGMAPERVAKFLGSYGWGVVEHLGYVAACTQRCSVCHCGQSRCGRRGHRPVNRNLPTAKWPAT